MNRMLALGGPASLLIVVCLSAPFTRAVAAAGPSARSLPAARHQASSEQADYICPMHPDVHGASGAKCPRCGMALVKTGGTLDASLVNISLTPRALEPGKPATLTIVIRDPATEQPVRDLEPVHERPLHLFLVGQDLEYFDHLHPTPAADGSLSVRVTVPHAGVYKLYLDFMPRGGTPQLAQRSLITKGYGKGIARAHLVPDATSKAAGGLRVDLQLPADGLVAGRTQLFRLVTSAADTGSPVTDLQPYLGAPAHLFVVSDDLEFAEHSHPVSDFSDASGPGIVFDAMFPHPGVYRMWAQFQRHGHIVVVPFTVRVRPDQ